MESLNLEGEASILVAREALDRGYQPVPIRLGTKAPRGAAWTHRRIAPEEVEEEFAECESVGLLLGEASGGLVDVDLDHPIAWRLRDTFLPPTRMRTGRPGNPASHYWYRVIDDIPGYRKYTLPGGETAVELRSSSGHQTLIPPSMWYSKDKSPAKPERYRWEGEPWGGDDGPAEISGKQLAVRVASLALASVLVENWPREGSRHDAYLALAGGMLRFGSEGVHPFWKQALPQLIEALAEATHDREAQSRVGEVVPSTETKLSTGGKVNGWPVLEMMIGEPSVSRAKTLVREIEGIVEWRKHLPLPSTQAPLIPYVEVSPDGEEETDESAPEQKVNPLDARDATWEPVNLEPYLAGEVVVPDPQILRRTDGKGIFYPGRVNSLYGKSESAKSWIALYACLQEIAIGARVLYIDLEDDPAMTIQRLRLMGAGDDDIRAQFAYIRPEGPHVLMQRDRWGNVASDELGFKNQAALAVAMARHDPWLIVVDGMSVLYGLHNLDTNDTSNTDVITSWLKGLCDNGRRTVIVIDHTSKGAGKGDGPIGSQHKISMVQGCAIQVIPIIAPRPGILGHVELAIGKDRPGAVRQVSSPAKVQIVADVFMDSTDDRYTRVTIQPWTPGAVTLDLSEVKVKVVKSERERVQDGITMVFGGDMDRWLTGKEIRGGFDAEPSTGAFSEAIRDLVKAGILRTNGKDGTRSVQYALGSEDDAGTTPESD